MYDSSGLSCLKALLRRCRFAHVVDAAMYPALGWSNRPTMGKCNLEEALFNEWCAECRTRIPDHYYVCSWCGRSCHFKCLRRHEWVCPRRPRAALSNVRALFEGCMVHLAIAVVASLLPVLCHGVPCSASRYTGLQQIPTRVGGLILRQGNVRT